MNTTTTQEQALTDLSIMPIGKHRGKRMIDVPAIYLLWIHNNNDFDHAAIKKYVLDNLDVINKEAAKAKR